MKKIALTSLIMLALAGCADATRTVPVVTVEHRPISSVYYSPRIVVPANRYYLPPPQPRVRCYITRQYDPYYGYPRERRVCY